MPIDQHLGLVDALNQWATRQPDHAAVHDSRQVMTFGQLGHLSGRAAQNLHARGVRRGNRVAVAADKRVETVAAMVGVMKCGAAFIPLDTTAPASRIAQLLDDAAPAALVGGPPAPAASAPAQISLEDLFAEPGTEAELPAVDGDDVAYCLYTSGSTGRPKGVQIHHDALVAFFGNIDRLLEVDETCRFLNSSPFFFDASVVDFWYPLARGAETFILDHLVLPDRTLDIIEQHRVTHVGAVGSVLSLLRRARRGLDQRDLSALRRIGTGAEILDPANVKAWLSAAPGATLVNGYGPTEATVCFLAHAITVDDIDRAPYPIGSPFPGVDVLVVDTDDQPCPPGEVGELLVAGRQVTRGYLNRPDEDERAFVVLHGTRWYRTGDLVIEGEDGVFHFRGRRDHELKVRGHRIHPAEVAAALQQCAGVADSHVTTAEDERGERVLAAAVVASEGVVLDGNGLRLDLRERLPDYMVPRQVLVLAELPRLPSGKVDDRGLAALFSDAVARPA